MITDTTNTIFDLAASFVNNTSRHIFLTGKAGTGKTTFLKYIQEHAKKNAVVVAPTGVAAINAGGVTIHSFFQLPFGPFIPDDEERFALNFQNEDVNNAFNLVKKIRLTGEKKALMRKMELLIIDEISMVRADMLDAIDAVLRFVRKNSFQPFGGVQVLYIGDLFQLPPVVQEDEWNILRQLYESPFFFHAKAVSKATPLYIELKKIYRQKDQRFIDVLNRVRNNSVTTADLNLLNERYQPGFKPDLENPYIVLSTHNSKTDTINTLELEKLPGPLFTFSATVTGDFSERIMPTENSLQLKVGAQVLFIKNDSEKRYYNGKIGRVSRILDKVIYIHFEAEKEDFALTQEKWKNIRYSFNEEKNRIQEEELGTFTQYPIRLAWAITIHKSQGLTFTKAIVDAGASFAPGQVYVALSRCTSMEGMVLRSLIQRHCIKTDEKVIAFASREAELNELQDLLKEEEVFYEKKGVIDSYDLTRLVEKLEDEIALMTAKAAKERMLHLKVLNELLTQAIEMQEVAARFRIQLNQLLKAALDTGNEEPLKERMLKANDYFAGNLGNKCLTPLKNHIGTLKARSNGKKQVKPLEELLTFIAKIKKEYEQINS
ncbi:MAG: AAA family ATPase [Chitinophagaceae bacterium]|nr:AAA family ATPase [Chitinophagaceae bacterium]